jgi:hypothetical protein
MSVNLLFLPIIAAVLGALLAPLFTSLYLRPSRLRRILSPLLSDPALTRSMLPLAEGHIDDFLRNKLPKAMPVIGMLIGDKTITQFKAVFMEELQALFPVFMEGCAARLLTPGGAVKRYTNKLIIRVMWMGLGGGAVLGGLQCLILMAIGPSGLLK